MLLPQEIAEQLTPEEYTDLCAVVEGSWRKAFGVVKVTRKHKQVQVIVELDDDTHHEVSLSRSKKQS